MVDVAATRDSPIGSLDSPNRIRLLGYLARRGSLHLYRNQVQTITVVRLWYHLDISLC